MIQLIGRFYARLFARPVFAKINRALFYMSARGLGLHNYETPALSGENYLIRKLITESGTPTIFDVGANQGNWSELVLTRNPNIKLHVFEPQPGHHIHLSARLPAAIINKVAVGDGPGTLALYDYAGANASEHATLIVGVIEDIHQGTTKSIDVPVITIDDYCSSHKVLSIDLLKIDVEGYEYRVLLGAKRMLAEQAIKAIQFEFNEMLLLEKRSMEDFINLLGSEFELYRLLPNQLLPLKSSQHWLNNQMAFQNIVAIQKSTLLS
jgi:FkbM family methyltransferase